MLKKRLAAEMAALPASLTPNCVVVVLHRLGLTANCIDVKWDSQPVGRILVFSSNIGLQIGEGYARKRQCCLLGMKRTIPQIWTYPIKPTRPWRFSR